MSEAFPHLSLDAPAKINLALHVTGRLQDGYHLLDTLVVFAGLGDQLAFAPAPADSFAIAGPFAPGLAADAGNLVIRARDLLRGTAPDSPPVAIRLTKNLPLASGIGGGSSDAAATLRGLAALWRLPHDEAALTALGARLGADVPMCLVARPLVARGVGDIIEPLDRWPPLHLVVANPGVEVATPAVFAALDRRDNPPLPPLPLERDAAAVLRWLGHARNDLEAPAVALVPAIRATLDALRFAGAGLARMSGSGATCFGVFGDAQAAMVAANMIRRREPGWFVAATRTSGMER